jgi:hypothetical protein
MAEKDIPEILRQIDETLARLKTATDDETRLALLREMAHLLTEAHALLTRAA